MPTSPNFQKQLTMNLHEQKKKKKIHKQYIFLWGSKTKAHDRGPGTPFH